MVRPSFDVFRQLADLGVDLITLPIETMGELTMQAITYIKDMGFKSRCLGMARNPNCCL